MLDPIARRCLVLAWQGWCAGTLPVGAVVTDASGAVVTAERGRMFEPAPVPGRLAGCAIAHAEINALAQLPAASRRPNDTLHVSLEPCLMCVGAAGMAALGRLRFLGADPYAGASRHYRRTPYLEELPLRVDGPNAGAAGALGSALHLAYYLRTAPGAPAVTVHRRTMPDLFDLAFRIVELDARQPDPAAAGLFDLVAEPDPNQPGDGHPGTDDRGDGRPTAGNAGNGRSAAGEEAGRA